jgi:anti-sigma regulatory factor (Ser/Thr protein kinase)
VRAQDGALSRTAVGYRHEALLYAGADDFVERIVPFITDGLAAAEPVLVAAEDTKLDLLRRALAADAERVTLVDMGELGRNPARVIPAWLEFVAGHERQPLRGVGEPIGPDRTADELIECARHEALLNLALAPSTPLWLLCPYDVGSLAPAVIDEARVNHPYLAEAGASSLSAVFCPPDPGAPFASPLSDAPPDADQLVFDLAALRDLRRFVAGRSTAFGLPDDRISDLIVAVNELGTNSVRHGGGFGVVRLWVDGDDVVAEVRDRGVIADPLVGRERPAPGSLGGRGLWLVNQLCDLVQVRSSPAGAVVRVRVRRAA